MRSYLKQGKYSYSSDDLLGEGTFGKVFKGYNHLQSYWMALKQIQLSKLQKYGDQLKTIVLSEINVMRKFTQSMKKQPCPYIVSQEDCFRTENFIFIAMQLCNGGTLEEYLKNRKLSEAEAIQILFCLCKGLEYMNKLGITHRDIKPQNIFIGSGKIEGKESGIFKIGDFGFADRKQDYDIAMGTLPYMAPEMFKKQKYTSKVDIWSLGVIAHELMFKTLYFMGKDKWEFQKNIKQKPFALNEVERSIVSAEYYDLIAKCLIKNPQQRISISELIQHPLFAKRQIQQKIDIFTKIKGLVQECITMKEMYDSFIVFGEQTSRMTEFIRIYLLKEAYSMINRIAYTVKNKQDYIGIPEEEFYLLTSEEKIFQYNSLYQFTQKECLLITNLFNEKYKQFSQYIQKFQHSDQCLISQTLDENPYSYVHAEVFEKQISKWAQSLKEYPKWKTLQQNCERMALIRAQSD